jgi:FAD/FMN-containing dehydrogenase
MYGNMQPAAVVMAETTSDVVTIVNCAVSSGYRISPRGRNHHFQGLSNMNGFVVVDCSLLCDPATFNFTRVEEDWILPGQKYIATVQGGSGCTNGVMVAATHKHFAPSEGALYAIGSCPSVGIAGYTTGGGSGDATPFTGWGVDDLLEVQMVLWDGRLVTASADENPDLFWATRGGGSGNGIITSLTTVVPQSPEPPTGESARRFAAVTLGYATPDDTSRKAFLTALQKFLYDVDPLVSSKFGGGGALNNDTKILKGIFLGSVKEFVNVFEKNGLLEEGMLNQDTASACFKDYELVCGDGAEPCSIDEDGVPTSGVRIFEFSSYGEMILFRLCLHAPFEPSMSQSSSNWCTDLGIAESFCSTHFMFGFPIEVPICNNREVIEAFADAAYDPLSFMNQAGPSVLTEEYIPNFFDNFATSRGGLLIPRLDIETLMDLDEIGLAINHFQHGAPMTVPKDATAFPWRDTAIMTEFQDNEKKAQVFSRMATFYGDERKLQGYYNYMSPPGNPNWRYHYFGENYKRLSQIKLEYDPYNFFGNNQQVEPAMSKEPSSISSMSSNSSTSSKAPHCVGYHLHSMWILIVLAIL